MMRFVLLCVSFLVLAAAPAFAGEQAAKGPSVRHIASPPQSTEDCEARIQKLDASQSEGEERLAEKNEVIDFCAGQYRHDRMIDMLVKECARYEEQPVVKQQFVADCQLAAYGYANELRALKAGYRK